MKITSKGDIFSPAFELNDGGLAIKADVTFDSPLGVANPFVHLPELVPGVDYSIIPSSENPGDLTAATAWIPGELGGFHVGLDGQIVAASIWDTKFRPACPDARAMVFVGGCWVDIYLLAADSSDRTSIPHAEIARNISHWEAVERLAKHGKQLLSIDEFYLAALGSAENKTAHDRPELTGHVEGLRSTVGLEQATGCMWTWGRQIDPRVDTAALMGGSWRSLDAGPRRLYFGVANDSSGDYIGARGRCDHLVLV